MDANNDDSGNSDNLESEKHGGGSRMALFLPGVFCLGLAILASPVALIRSGLMDGSLASVDPDVRTFSHTAVGFVRIALAVLGGVLIMVTIIWRLVRDAAPHLRAPARTRLGGASFVLMAVVWVLAVLFVTVGAKQIPEAVYAQINQVVLPKLAGAGFAATAVLGGWLAIRSIAGGLGRGPGILVVSTALGVICVGMATQMHPLPVFGFVEADSLSMFILGYIVLCAMIGRAPVFGRAFDYIGLPLPSLGLAAGALLAIFISGWALDPFLGHVAWLDTGALRLVILSIASLVMMAEVRGRYFRFKVASEEGEPARAHAHDPVVQAVEVQHGEQMKLT